MNNTEEKTSYIGSVRFYKHMILSVVATLILVPTALCVFFAVRSIRLADENAAMNQEMTQLQLELTQVQDHLSHLQQELALQNAAVQELTETLETHAEEENVAETVAVIPDWQLILVSEASPLEADYEVELVKITGGQKVDTRIVSPLTEMMKQMRNEGMSPLVCSGYRSLDKQSNLFHEYIDEKVMLGWDFADAFYKAKTRIALPGTSEHHTGLAVDIVGKDHQSLNDAQAYTPEAKWLKEHCAEYGFILRYPQGKTDITGIDFESWHFRYVGIEAATYIMENNLTLEEYLEIAYDQK